MKAVGIEVKPTTRILKRALVFQGREATPKAGQPLMVGYWLLVESLTATTRRPVW